MMRARSLGMTLVGVAMIGLAGCSASAGSIGVVQDDAVASPQATSAESSPGTNGGLGAAVPGASCAEGGACQVGDTGPGGGTVFYVASAGFPCGATTCTYLEVAPNLWNPNSQASCKGGCGGSSQQTSDFSSSGKGISWCTGLSRNQYVSRTYTGVGYGYSNTAYMNSMCGAGSASQAAAAYRGGGLTDWYLASKDELAALYSYPNRNSIGGFTPGKYWSSSGGYPQGRAWWQDFHKGEQGQEQANGSTEGVRPIRAF